MIISAYYSHIMASVRQTGLSLEEVAKKLLENHIEGFDVIKLQVDDGCLENIKTLKACGMKMCSLPAHTDFVHTPSLSEAEEIVSLAKDLGASVIMAIPGFFSEGDDKEAAREASLTAIRHMIALGEKEGIKIGVEDYDDVNSAVAGIEGVSWYLEHEPALHCIFDTGNFAFMGDDVLSAFDSFRSRIKYQIHCNDKTLSEVEGTKARVRKTGDCDYPAAVGSGVMHCGEILTALVKDGFDGIITIENFGSPNALNDLISSGQFIYKTVTEAGAEI